MSLVSLSQSKFRSKCPASCALDILGDKWSLLIIRDMIYFKKKTFNEFLKSNEKIATNILASRLKKLENFGLISKQNTQKNKKINIYKLTEIGLDIIPTLIELTMWSIKNVEKTESIQSISSQYLKDKAKLVSDMKSDYLASLNDI